MKLLCKDLMTRTSLNSHTEVLLYEALLKVSYGNVKSREALYLFQTIGTDRKSFFSRKCGIFLFQITEIFFFLLKPDILY